MRVCIYGCVASSYKERDICIHNLKTVKRKREKRVNSCGFITDEIIAKWLKVTVRNTIV